mmetsp:Transcript_27595/g.65446  ORF Transcript_27595/g.65446 Transcript_27595/m.65446 type:complete len:95 (-) Transcript_27595:186-470(-)
MTSTITLGGKKERRRGLVVLEIGAGVRVPTVRQTSEKLIRQAAGRGGMLIRVNPDFPQRNKAPADSFISLKEGALVTLRALDEIIARLSAPQVG